MEIHWKMDPLCGTFQGHFEGRRFDRLPYDFLLVIHSNRRPSGTVFDINEYFSQKI